MIARPQMNRLRLLLWFAFGASSVFLFTILIANLELNYYVNYNYDTDSFGVPTLPPFYSFFKPVYDWFTTGSLYSLSAWTLSFFLVFLASFYYLRRSKLQTTTLAIFVFAFHSTLICALVPYDRTLFVINFQAHFVSWFTNQDLMLFSVPSTIILAVFSIRQHKMRGLSDLSIWRKICE
jgi:hypothetical protein